MQALNLYIIELWRCWKSVHRFLCVSMCITVYVLSNREYAFLCIICMHCIVLIEWRVSFSLPKLSHNKTNGKITFAHLFAHMRM